MKTNSTNLFLIIVGLGIMTIGLFREVPLKFDQRFWWNTVPLAVVFLAVITLAIYVGGIKYFLVGIDGAVSTSATFLLTLVLLMPLIGFSAPVAHHFEATIGQALSGPFGYGWGIISAFLTPGGNALSGVVSRLWAVNHHLRPLLLYFLTTVPLTSLTIYYIRQLGLGPEIAKEMYKVNWMVAIWLMPFFWVWGRYFYKV